MIEENEPQNFENEDAVNRIVNLTEELSNFWSNSSGWASIEAADLLNKSRLDWQASLSRTLRIFLNNDLHKEEGALILAWTNLGSLTEGVLKLFLSVSYEDYKADVKKYKLQQHISKSGKIIEPDILTLEKLRTFFAQKVYPQKIRDIWKEQGRIDIIDWILKIQQKRNAIHAFKTRDIGDFDEFFRELKNFLIIMRRLTGAFPYPDEIYRPRET